ncbi:hypothetical protein NPX13_g1490 [Xylaria arbuscula]|uniref:Uncharacterized protein n=1 Tax=Xylaria arbuscula TaxID=114810 RepID=A0A9W8NLC0_9PEZI|nr:hypothetical protein NPX13_g1490 [Xylaria arbuscula]
MGRLSVGLFPRLGTLSGLSRLLDKGTKYLDHASTKGGSSRTVRDVKWGSVFPCANGAACSTITSYLRSVRGTSTPLQRMPEKLLSRLRTVTSEKDESKPSIRAGGEAIRRSQILHVYQLHRVPKRCSTRDRFDQLRLSLPGQIIYSLILLSLAVLFGLLGSYGSAALVACTSVSELVALNITIRRPSTYLKNNETHDACMLVASHENATEWHLYIGDRGIAHTILNKPMFVVPEGLWARVASSWFRFANLLQFAAMTFVAAQKGWDGVWMVVILATHWTVHYTLYGRTLARDWLEREGVQVKVASFEFGGRYAMMGAIHIFSRSAVTRWMDDILVPHRRREAWLQCLKGEQVTVELDAHDTTWVKSNSEAACAAASVLEETFETAARNITPMAV